MEIRTPSGGNSSAAAAAAPDATFAAACGVVILAFLLIGAVGNWCILVAILSRRRMRQNPINLFIASLCINDLVNLLLNQSAVAASYLCGAWLLGDLLCELMPELNMLLVCISLWHHALIALHRYIVVVHSSTYIALHKGMYSCVMLVGTRALAAALSLSRPLFNSGQWLGMTEYRPKMLRCVYTRRQRARIAVVMLGTQLLPCGIVLACFALIFVFVHRTGAGSTARADRQLFRRELQITKMFGAVFALFLAGFLPYGCLRTLDSKGSCGPEAYAVATVLYAMASCASPVVFGVMNSCIRKAATACCRRRA